MAFFYKYEYTNKRKNIYPWQSLSKMNLCAGFRVRALARDKTDDNGQMPLTDNHFWSCIINFCAEGGREEKADLGKSERLCGGRKRREGNWSANLQHVSSHVHFDICVSKNLHRCKLKIAVLTDCSHRREEKRARKERKHQKRQKNVSSSTEESPAKVGSNYWVWNYEY